ncbi:MULTISPECIES: ABC transporter permease [unclassified Clostridium]|uniref:ABC transporter permease n=1 Tax=unclassified Clostridium TaxID=2614128 RepID=UPI0013F01803|nr:MULTISPECIES: ABC transporter permease [unclassified Clostridium]NFG61145.1 ABC transporter permease [Clostridium botulinum]NFQ08891.1 ABC transporter permease [Clostridium botulinum]
MLGKLMKYETKATGRVLLPLYAALLIFALINKIFMNNDFSVIDRNTLGGIPAFLSIFAYVATMIAVFVVTFFVIIQRFYKNILGDEGYLMHTLPVAPWQNICSKLLVAIIWSIVSGIVAMLSVLILTFNSNALNPDLFRDICNAFSLLYAQYGISGYMVGLEFIIAALSQLSMGILMIYASISIGHLFNKRKILSSFGAFIVLNIIMNTIISTIAIIFADKYSGSMISWNISSLNQVHEFFIGGILFHLFFFICYFLITNYIIKNKLNLE